jgi:hypothetical protein
MKMKVICSGHSLDCKFTSCPFNHNSPDGYECVLHNFNMETNTIIKIEIEKPSKKVPKYGVLEGVE